jgi:hypothetical protein
MKRLLVPTVSFLFFLIALLVSKDYPQGPRLYPLVIIICGITFSSAVLIRETKRIQGERNLGQFGISYDRFSKDPFLIKQLFVVISTISYTILAHATGFIIISIVYTFLIFYVLGFRKRLAVVFISLAFPLLLYVVFGVMIKIALPRVFLEDWISEIVR